MSRASASVLVLSLLLCAGDVTAAERFGEAVPAGEVLPVSQAVTDATEEFGPLRSFSGRITEVCQNKGCWVMLESDGTAARVMMKDHAFALPKDASGEAVVYGRLQRRTLDEAMAKHLAEDAGRDAPVPREEFRIEAIGVELRGG